MQCDIGVGSFNLEFVKYHKYMPVLIDFSDTTKYPMRFSVEWLKNLVRLAEEYGASQFENERSQEGNVSAT